MWRPTDDLDDFKTGSRREPAEPPSSVLLESSGEVEVLKPLARWEGPIKIRKAPGPRRRATFYRTLGVAGVAVIALVTAAGIFVWNGGRNSGPLPDARDTAASMTIGNRSVEQPPADETGAAPQEPGDSDLLPPESYTDTSSIPKTAAPRLKSRRRAARPRTGRNVYASDRPRVRFATYHAVRRPLPRPQFIVSDFVPTTLVIYVEKGEIKTRIETQRSASEKRSPAGSQQ